MQDLPRRPELVFDAMAEVVSPSVPVVFPVILEIDRAKRTGGVDETGLTDYTEACLIGVIVAGASKVHLVSEDATEEPVELNLTANCGNSETLFYRTDSISSASFRIHVTCGASPTATLSNGDQSFNVDVWRQHYHTSVRLNWDLSKELLDRVLGVVCTQTGPSKPAFLPCLPASRTTNDFSRKRSTVNAMCTFCGGLEEHIETRIRFYRQITSFGSQYLILDSHEKPLTQSSPQTCTPSRLAGGDEVAVYIRENAASWDVREARDRLSKTVYEDDGEDEEIDC